MRATITGTAAIPADSPHHIVRVAMGNLFDGSGRGVVVKASSVA
jgi:hypothetical protein